MPTVFPPSPDILGRVRAVLLGILLFGLVGTLVELFLLEHTDGFWQWVPIVLFGFGLVSIGWWVIARSQSSLRALQGVMLSFLAAGVIGTVLHYDGNAAFELEMMPGLGGLELFGKAMMGATPTLAPGVMIQLGLIGLLYTYRHPVSTSSGAKSRTSER
jgi:hypothetical protein